MLLSAFSVISTATYSYQRPHRSPRLRSLADASNLQINLILLVLLLVRTDTARTAENEAGNVMYSTDTAFLNEQCYGKTFSLISLRNILSLFSHIKFHSIFYETLIILKFQLARNSTTYSNFIISNTQSHTHTHTNTHTHTYIHTHTLFLSTIPFLSNHFRVVVF